MLKYRSDKDSLGPVKIPADAYYGPFTGRAIKQDNVTGSPTHRNLIKSIVMIKRSAAVANMKTKAINRKQGTAIVKACDKILAGKFVDQFLVDMINRLGKMRVKVMQLTKVTLMIIVKILTFLI